MRFYTKLICVRFEFLSRFATYFKIGDVIMVPQRTNSLIVPPYLSLSICNIQVLINKLNKFLSLSLSVPTVRLVEKDTARLTEASREGSEQRKRPRRKILVHEGGVEGPVCASRGRRRQWGRKKREQGERGSAIYVSISWRARVDRCSHPCWWTADRGPPWDEATCRPSRVPLSPPPPRLTADAAHGHGVGPPEDAPEDPTPFQASALLRHSRVMLLDLGDPHGWLYSGHAGRTAAAAASNVATRRLACTAIYRVLMIDRQKRAASRDLMTASWRNISTYASNRRHLIARTFEERKIGSIF